MAFLRAAPPYETPIVSGDGLFLRMPSGADYAAWAELRAQSRTFLTPWEPTWPSDDLTRTAFRRRIRRYQAEIRDDRAYPFFIFRQSDDALLGGITLSNVARGMTQTATLGYWMGERHANLRRTQPAQDRGGLPAAQQGVHLPSGACRIST